MGTVQKRADELKPGDVVVIFNGNRICLLAEDGQTDDGARIFYASELGENRAAGSRYFSDDQQWSVESRDLTPAQQHAEEMVEQLKSMRDVLVNHNNINVSQFSTLRESMVILASALLDKIKPPEPPTLEEALAALDNLSRAGRKVADPLQAIDAADAVLDRARRAGVLK